MKRQYQDGPVETPFGLRCSDDGSQCKHLRVYDFHYPYCDAQPDTSPALRPGGGTHLFWFKPNEGCPFKDKAKEQT